MKKYLDDERADIKRHVWKTRRVEETDQDEVDVKTGSLFRRQDDAVETG